MTHSPLRYFVLGVALVFLGCGPSGKKDTSLVLKGNVTTSGKALPGGQITFSPASGSGNAVSAIIGGDGNYEVSLPAGEYKVVVDNSNLKSATSAAMPGAGATDMPGMGGGNTQKYVPINAKYAKADTSGLSTKVDANSLTYNVELK